MALPLSNREQILAQLSSCLFCYSPDHLTFESVNVSHRSSLPCLSSGHVALFHTPEIFAIFLLFCFCIYWKWKWVEEFRCRPWESWCITWGSQHSYLTRCLCSGKLLKRRREGHLKISQRLPIDSY